MKKNGVPMMVAPEGYPGTKYEGRAGHGRRYAFIHNVVWWQKTGNLPRPGYVVSHRDGDVENNEFKNLFERVKDYALAGLVRPITHGTGGYRQGCRCVVCKAARSKYFRTYRVMTARKRRKPLTKESKLV